MTPLDRLTWQCRIAGLPTAARWYHVKETNINRVYDIAWPKQKIAVIFQDKTGLRRADGAAAGWVVFEVPKSEVIRGIAVARIMLAFRARQAYLDERVNTGEKK